MQAPLDYPINDRSSTTAVTSEDLTYAALLDRHESEQLITDEMIHQACLGMEAAQQFPFATKVHPQPFAALDQTNPSDHPSSVPATPADRMRQYLKRTIG